MTDWVAIIREAIPVGGVMEFIGDPAAGGVCVFVGTTRAERNGEGVELAALEYEAYEEMAREQLEELARRAREKWGIVKVAMLHRVGRVGVGEASVVIAVSAGHREEAFAACRFLIDTLKAEVAIWKKEVWGDGAERWKQSEKNDAR